MEYVKLVYGSCGYKTNDIAKVIENKVIENKGNGIVAFVPNRDSTSGKSPNVYYSLGDYVESTEEEYNKQHDINSNEIKPEDLIKGKYYVATDTDIDKSYIWIEKHNTYKNNEIHSNESIDIINKTYSKNGFNYTNDYTYRKATQSQIDWLEACIKADKFIPESKIESDVEEILAKKGDYVVLKHYANKNNNSNWNDILINHVYQLRKDCNIFNFRLVKDNNSSENGWGISKPTPEDYIKYGSLSIRHASSSERDYYLKHDKPFDINSIEYEDWLEDQYKPNKPNKKKELEMFYIKYNSSFTEKVFHQLVDKIIGLGYPIRIHIDDQDIKDGKLNFETFKRSKYLRTQCFIGGGNSLSIDNNRQDVKTQKYLSEFKLKYDKLPDEEHEDELIDNGWSDTPLNERRVLNDWSVDTLQPRESLDHLKPNVIKTKKKINKLITVKQLKL